MRPILPGWAVAIALGGVLMSAHFDAHAACGAGAPASLAFVDEQGREHTISSAEIAKLPRVTAKVIGHDNQPAEYEGVRLSELLQARGVVLGKELRGARVANYLLFEAEDGYRVVLAIAEVDPATTDKLVLLAERKNGAALPDKEGPWRLVIPDDKRPVRWIRMLKRISVRAAEPDTAK
jgi:DMSO/TMAO reductase YedYZ molybdopterin-dependent catalytic subunit